MRLLQYQDLLKVTSESGATGMAGSVRYSFWFFRALIESEKGLQRRLKPSVVQRSIVFSNTRGDSFATRAQGSNTRRLKQVKRLLRLEEFQATSIDAGQNVRPLKASSAASSI